MLKNLQRDFQNYLLQDDPQVEKNIISSQQLSAKNRLQIYQNSYYERFVVAMMQDFPRLCDAIGESAFRSLVIDYVTYHPSMHFNLRYLGQHLSEFILSRDPAFKLYAELAQEEWRKLEIYNPSLEACCLPRSPEHNA